MTVLLRTACSLILLLATAVAIKPTTTPGVVPVALGTTALTGVATASSQAGSSEAPAMAVDGNLSTRWRASGTALPQWLHVDLGRIFALEKVQQTFAADGVWGFRVEGSVDNTSWATLIDKRHRLAGRTFAESVTGLYRYVRLTVTAAPAGQSASSQELTIAGSGNGTNIAVGRAVSASSSLTDNGVSYAPGKAVDGGTGTYWAASSGTYPQWLSVDLGQLAWVTGVEQNFKDSGTFGFRIEASADGSTWMMLLDRTAGISGQSFAHATAGNYRHIRLTLTSAAQGYWAGSVEFKVFGFDNVALGKPAAASSAAAGYETSRAVDGNTATFWGATTAGMPQWLTIDLGEPVALHRIEQSFVDPTTWRFTVEGSLDNAAWTMLVDHSAGAAGQHFARDVTGRFRYVRLTVQHSAGGQWACSQELKVYGAPVARNLAVGVRATSSSLGPGFEPFKAVDGNPVTYWGASSATMPQSLVVDLGNESILQRVEQSFVENVNHRFTIEGSRDKTAWTMLLDRSAGATGRVFSQTVSGVHRYLRLTITNSSEHWAASQELRAIGIGSPVTSRWWEHTSGIMRYYPKYYRQTLNSISNGLEGLKAQGYTGIELTAVWAGPTDLWAGLGATDLYTIDPSIGTMADFENLLRRAHDLGMVVHFFANPGYAHITAPFFQKAERDYRDGINSVERQWFDFQPCQGANGQWRWSPTARACFFGYWDATLPSFNWSTPQWRAEAKKYLRFWADKGVDGFGLDAPAVYHYNDVARNNEVITDTLRNYDIMLNPEGIQTWSEYPRYMLDWHYSVIHDLEISHWGGCGRSRLIPGMNSQNPMSPTDIDLLLKLSRDPVNAAGGTTITAPSWELDGAPGNSACPPETTPDVSSAKRLLEIATLTTMGTLFYMHNGNHLILPHTDRIPAWPAADQARLTSLLKAQSSYDALSPAGLRVKLPTNNNSKFYAYKRTNKDGSVAALVILNFQASTQSVTVNLANTGIGTAQAPIDLLSGQAAAPINGASYTVSLPAYGFAVLAVEKTQPVRAGQRLESYNNPGHFVRHRFAQARIDSTIVPVEDSWFRVVPGLADSNAVSFESVNFPGTYLRHQNGLIYQHPFTNTALFRQDATFYQVAGLANANGYVSFRSYNFPTNYIRYDSGGFLRIDPVVDAAAATFRLRPP